MHWRGRGAHDSGVSTSGGAREPVFAVRGVTRRVVASQALFTAGHVLSTGGFLYYFANSLDLPSVLFSVLMVTPEIAESSGVFVRPLVLRFGNRKRIWIVSLIAARVFALGVPLIGLGRLGIAAEWRWWLLIGCVAAWYVCQGVSYVAYVSWLSDLVPEMQWGRFFAKRNVARLVITLLVVIPAAFTRRELLSELDDPRWAYVEIFLAGAVLCVASILPMLKVPSVPTLTHGAPLPSWTVFLQAMRSRGFALLVVQSWWLSFAQGLSQVAFFRYKAQVLGVPLEIYYTMYAAMRMHQIGWALIGGSLSDRVGDKWPQFFGLLAVSGAVLFWLSATPETWWLLYGAYALWGLFGMVNLCGQNLALRLSPGSDNSLHLGLYRQIGGMLSGVAGLVGGLWLDRLLEADAAITVAGMVLGPFQIIFAVSFLGRLTAPLWLLPVPSHPHPEG